LNQREVAGIIMTAILSAEDFRGNGVAWQLRHNNEYREPNRPTAAAADAQRLVELAKGSYCAVSEATKQSS
jgi:hypothetical protein